MTKSTNKDRDNVSGGTLKKRRQVTIDEYASTYNTLRAVASHTPPSSLFRTIIISLRLKRWTLKVEKVGVRQLVGLTKCWKSHKIISSARLIKNQILQ